MNVVIVGHKCTHGILDELLDYLRKKNISTLMSISHPLPPFGRNSSSTAEIYKEGKLEKIIEFPLIKGSETILFIKDAIAVLVFTLLIKKRFTVYFGVDSLNTIIGLFLRKIGLVRIVIYNSHSYHRFRFGNPVKNLLYHVMDYWCIRSANFIWNLSRRLTAIREGQGVPKEKNLWVPIGVDLEKIKHLPPDFVKRNRLVFVGLLVPKNGVQLIIKALPYIVNKAPKVELKIIGTGPLEARIKDIVKEEGLENHVEFLGYMPHDKVMKYLPGCGIGLAPYVPLPDSTLRSTDPTKPKEYMACGLPVIITKVPESASEISENGAGFIINYDKMELAEAIMKLLVNDKIFCECKRNAVNLSSRYDWKKIFNNAFREISDLAEK